MGSFPSTAGVRRADELIDSRRGAEGPPPISPAKTALRWARLIPSAFLNLRTSGRVGGPLIRRRQGNSAGETSLSAPCPEEGRQVSGRLQTYHRRGPRPPPIRAIARPYPVRVSSWANSASLMTSAGAAPFFVQTSLKSPLALMRLTL